MKKILKKLSLALVLAMAVSLIAPAAQTVEAAEEKTFTYAEQKTGDTVTTLVMDKGEKVDLKFNDVSNWRTYKYKWDSSNPKVAVVDSAGVVTAISNGVATIKLTISGGDGTKFKSVGVIVYVGLEQEVTIGTTSQDEIKSYTIEMGKTAVLKANGLKDNVGDRYEFDWTSTDTGVATINSSGVITPKAPGLTVICLSVKKVFSGEIMQATPIALLVTEKGAYVPTVIPTPTSNPLATVTPAPTNKPAATSTPIPSVIPTATVTPVPSDAYTPYTVKLESDRSILLTFSSKVDYNITDITLYKLITAGNAVVPVKCEIANVTADSTGKLLQVTSVNPMSNGDKYLVKAGTADTEGTTFNVYIGEPNRMEITYECLGKEGVAYAYDDVAAIDVPVNLSYRLYYGTIDVTDTYSDRGYITFDFVSNQYYENVSLSGNTLTFYAPNVSTVIAGKFTYYADNGNPKEINTTVYVRSAKLPAYGISRVVSTTIIDTNDTSLTKIDWDKTTNQIVANSEESKVVALIADTYGNYYTTDERGVDKSKKIYSINDTEQLFYKCGYGIEFSAADQNQILIAPDGTMYPIKATNNAVILVTLTNNGLNGVGNANKNIGAYQIKVLEESKLTSLTFEKTGVTLATSALVGYENRFCTTDVKILLKDQYGNKWNGYYDLELSSTITDVNNALDGSSYAPARLDGNTLHIDATNIKRVTNRASVSFVITEKSTNRKATITVKLQTPTAVNNSISVNGWSLGLQDSKIVLGDQDNDELAQYVTIESFKLSNNGVKVGLYDDLKILETSNYSFTTSNCHADEIYVLVKGPDNKVVAAAENENTIGVYVDEVNHCVKVNVAAPETSGSLIQKLLPAGTYSITATRIINVGTVVQKATQTVNFTVVDNTKDVTFRSLKSISTPLTVSGNNDLAGAKAIVESVLNFNLGGEAWTTMNANMITNVTYVKNGNKLFIKKVEFAVPINSNELYTMSYKKTCEVNKTITIGVSQ